MKSILLVAGVILACGTVDIATQAVGVAMVMLATARYEVA